MWNEPVACAIYKGTNVVCLWFAYHFSVATWKSIYGKVIGSKYSYHLIPKQSKASKINIWTHAPFYLQRGRKKEYEKPH